MECELIDKLTGSPISKASPLLFKRVGQILFEYTLIKNLKIEFTTGARNENAVIVSFMPKSVLMNSHHSI